MKRRYLSAILSLGAAACLTACGEHKGEAAAARPTPRPAPRPAAVPSKPAEQPYFIPAEWVAQAKAQQLLSEAGYMQALAIWLYQNQEEAQQERHLGWITALYSCADAAKSNGNEIERPAIYARMKAKLQQFFAHPPARGHAEFGGSLGGYDTATETFSWRAPGDFSGSKIGPATLPLPKVAVQGAHLVCMSTPTAQGMNWSPPFEQAVLLFPNATLPSIRVPTARASAFLQKHGSTRMVRIAADFTVPATSGGPIKSVVYGGAQLPVTYTGATVTEFSDKTDVLATFLH